MMVWLEGYDGGETTRTHYPFFISGGSNHAAAIQVERAVGCSSHGVPTDKNSAESTEKPFEDIKW